MRILLLILLSSLSLCNMVNAEPLTKHPVVERITTEGFQVGDEELVRLAPPLAALGMSPDEQRAAIEDLVGARRMKNYLRDSIVSPFKLDINTIHKTASGAAVRSLDLYFICRGSLDIIDQKDLLGSLAGGDEKPREQKDVEFKTYFERLGKKPSDSEEQPPQGTLVSSLFRYRFPILERVVISGLLRGEGLQLDGALIQTAVTPRDLLNDSDNPTRWQAMPRDAQADADLGPPEPFQGFACYLQATQLGFVDNAVLIECHAAYIEPYGWFDGRNILASKLPLVMQKSVREFRRKLKEAQEKVVQEE